MDTRQFEALFSRDEGDSVRSGRRSSAADIAEIAEIAGNRRAPVEATSTTPLVYDTSALAARLVSGALRTAQGDSVTDSFSCVLRLEDGTLASARVTIQFEGERAAPARTLQQF